MQVAPVEKFRELSPAEKRVAIAQDVLAQIAARKLHVRQGVYVGDTWKRRSGVIACEACALGSSFLASLELEGCPRIRHDEYVQSPEAYNQLRKYFSDTQMSIIECAFELKTYFGFAPTELKLKAIKWAKQVKGSENRLKAIMNNIIANNGCFIPVMNEEDTACAC